MHFPMSLDSNGSSSADEFTVVTIGGHRYCVNDIPGLEGMQIGRGNVCTVENGTTKIHRWRVEPQKVYHGGERSFFAPLHRERQHLTESTEPISQSHMNYISRHLGNAWESLASSLGMSRGQIETIEWDNRSEGTYEMAYQTLLKWKRQRGEAATVRDLAIALDSVGLSELASELPLM